MMNKTTPIWIGLFLIVIQVGILQNIQGMLWFQPYPYIFLLLVLTPDLPKWATLIICFAWGALFDIFFNSPGVHMIACLVLGYIKPFAVQFNSVKAPPRENETATWLHAARPGFRAVFVSLMVTLHHSLVLSLENWGQHILAFIVPLIGLNVLITLLLFLLLNQLFYHTFKPAK